MISILKNMKKYKKKMTKVIEQNKTVNILTSTDTEQNQKLKRSNGSETSNKDEIVDVSMNIIKMDFFNFLHYKRSNIVV